MKTKTCLGIILALLLTSMLTTVLNIRYARATVPFSDEFSSFALGSRWAVVDPDGGSSFDITTNPGWLRITTTSPPERDLYGPHATNAPRIMQSASENFTIETRVMATTDENDEGGGILVWKDSQNFLLFNRLSRTIGHPVEQQISLCAEGGGGGRRSNHTTLPSNLNPTYLKLVRSGDLFSGYYRSDVTTWVHAADLTFSIDDPVDIGLNVINTYHEGIFSADFDYFRFAKLVASRKLSIKLSGDFDYSSKGKVEVKVAVLVKDADTMEAVSDAKVTVDIYYQDGALWVSDDMTENHAGTGIYEWENSSPFILYIVSDEIFLVHVKASVGDGPVASDMLLLHIDAFADRSTFSLTPLIYYGIAIIALAAGAIVGIVLLSRHRKIQGTPHARARMLHKRRAVLLALLLSVCLLCSVGSFYVQNQQLRWEHQYQILAMRSSFMEPTLKTGDLLVVDTRRPAHITAAPKEADVPGDIIAFPDPRPDHRLRELSFLVSRVVEKSQVNETWYFHTKGDASSDSSYDPWGPVPEDWILGKVVDVNPLVIVFFVVRTDQQMLRSHWTTWLLLVVATAVGTGLASLLIFLSPPSRKQQAAPS